jgi:hypothetical protein
MLAVALATTQPTFSHRSHLRVNTISPPHI